MDDSEGTRAKEVDDAISYAIRVHNNLPDGSPSVNQIAYDYLKVVAPQLFEEDDMLES